jgi:hypothetical protein
VPKLIQSHSYLGRFAVIIRVPRSRSLTENPSYSCIPGSNWITYGQVGVGNPFHFCRHCAKTIVKFLVTFLVNNGVARKWYNIILRTRVKTLKNDCALMAFLMIFQWWRGQIRKGQESEWWVGWWVGGGVPPPQVHILKRPCLHVTNKNSKDFELNS